MSRFQLVITCKACMEGRHSDCSGNRSVFKVVPAAPDALVDIQCMCAACRGRGEPEV
jgi:hypothetical protein